MDQIKREHQAIRALVVARQIRLIALLLTVDEATIRFATTRAEVRDLLATGELRALHIDGRLWLPLWRLERAFSRR